MYCSGVRPFSAVTLKGMFFKVGKEQQLLVIEVYIMPLFVTLWVQEHKFGADIVYELHVSCLRDHCGITLNL